MERSFWTIPINQKSKTVSQESIGWRHLPRLSCKTLYGKAEIGSNPCATFGIEDFNDEFSIGEDKAGGYSIRCLKE